VKLKTLHISASDISGGAARAAYRLHRALMESGVDSWMLVQNKLSDDYTVIGPQSKLLKGLARIKPTLDALPVVMYKRRTNILFSPSWLPSPWIVRKIREINPDIVHFHWICGGTLSIEDIPKIKKPLVWSLHDMWAFTGGCHSDLWCGGYENGCGRCKILGSCERKDLSYWVWSRKKRVFDKVENLTVVGLSKWLATCAEKSSLLGKFKVVNLPNPIDVNVFKPVDKRIARQVFNLPREKKLVLFGAINPLSNVIKGFDKLKESMKVLKKKIGLKQNRVTLVILGASEPENKIDWGFDAVYVGKMHDDQSLCMLYNAVDVVVVPSVQENLSNLIMESLSCATPVVAFDIGGNGDMIEHKHNGYLAKPFDVAVLAEGINWVLYHSDYESLCFNARSKVLREFESSLVAQRYISLYRDILGL